MNFMEAAKPKKVNVQLVKGAQATADCHIKRLEQFSFLSRAGLGHSHCWFLTPTACMIRNTDGLSSSQASLMQNAVTKQLLQAPKASSSWKQRRSQRCERGSRFLNRDKQNLSLIHHWQALCLARRQRELPPALCEAKAGTGSYSKHFTAVIFHFH